MVSRPVSSPLTLVKHRGDRAGSRQGAWTFRGKPPTPLILRERRMRGHSWNFRGLQTLGPLRAPSSNKNTKITFCDRTGVKTNTVEVG